MLLHNFYKRRTVKLKELQSLIGLLNFTCQVIVPGRAFLRRLIDLTKGVRQPHHHIRLCKGSKQDLLLWMRFLDEFNGKSFFLEDTWETSHTLELYTDAAGSIGFGAVFGKHWFGGEWPVTWKSYNIAVLELFPIVLAIHIWGHLMADKSVIFFTDNAAVVDIINKQTSKHQSIMVLIRDLVLSCLRHNVLFHAKHIPGFYNIRADYISRCQVAKFKELSPDVDQNPATVGPVKDENSLEVLDDDMKADLFKQYFVNIGRDVAENFPNIPNQTDIQHIYRVSAPSCNSLVLDSENILKSLKNIKVTKQQALMVYQVQLFL
ncbi:uncharacterized protein [Montipora capricornis]|uniref:uncharacterized protein n=1 Tax=Montipora capricornis TaxID=246305 RepID=UPI0035F1AA88